jgi:hypothetical protein
MRVRSLVLILFAMLLGAFVYAGTSSLVYTAGQSTAIQTQLIPRYNADHCHRFGLPASCVTADLTTAGCTPTVIKTIPLDSCTIFTADVTGEAAILKEAANVGLVSVYNRLIADDNSSYQAAECTRFKGLSGANQNTECNLRGLANGCSGPCP